MVNEPPNNLRAKHVAEVWTIELLLLLYQFCNGSYIMQLTQYHGTQCNIKCNDYNKLLTISTKRLASSSVSKVTNP
jgi:hypothetical protein